jgi:hypothetical protein
MKESVEWIGRETAHKVTQDLLCRSGPVEGVPTRELEPTTAYRLRVFMRWVEKSQEGYWTG